MIPVTKCQPALHRVVRLLIASAAIACSISPGTAAAEKCGDQACAPQQKCVHSRARPNECVPVHYNCGNLDCAPTEDCVVNETAPPSYHCAAKPRSLAVGKQCGDRVCAVDEECVALPIEPSVSVCSKQGAVAGPTLLCYSDDKAVHCRLTSSGKLVPIASDAGALETAAHKPIAALAIDADGKGLSAAHGAAPGSVVRILVPIATAYSTDGSSKPAQRIAGIVNGRVYGSERFEVAVRVPGGPALSPVELVLPNRLGPVTLGMNSTELGKLGLPFTSEGPDDAAVGPFHVRLKDKRVVSIAFQLSESFRSLQILKAQLGAESNADQVASLVGRCGPLEMRRGGALRRCHEGRLLVTSAGPLAPGLVAVELTAIGN